MYDPDGVTLSDHLKWIGQTPTGVWSVTACPGPPVTPRATEMIFYSLDDFGDQTPTFGSTSHTNESADAVSHGVLPSLGNTFDGASEYRSQPLSLYSPPASGL